MIIKDIVKHSQIQSTPKYLKASRIEGVDFFREMAFEINIKLVKPLLISNP